MRARSVTVVAAMLAGLIVTSTFAQRPAPAGQPPTAGAAPASNPVSPFDQNDPEIAIIRGLDWKNAEYNVLTLPQRCAALMALNKGLSMMGSKADHRVDLLVDYLDQNKLGEAYAAAKQSIPDPRPVTFQDMERVAAAYINTPGGAAKFAGQFTGMSADMLNLYLNLYEKSAMREFEETREARWQVRSMGLFLQDTGKLEDFRQWSVIEDKRRETELDQQVADEKAKQTQERQQRIDAYNQEQRAQQQQQALAAKQMDAALQEQQYESNPQSSQSQQTSYVDNDGWWGAPYANSSYWYYYNSNAYRGYVRDKAQDAYQRWRPNGGARPTPLPAQRPSPRMGGGGGMRGGGRR
jgi:hypothetical protein